MPLSNSNISSTPPYDKLYEHIIVSQKAQGIRILIIVAPICFGLFAIAIGISQGWFYAISIGIFAWLLCFGLLGCAIYMYRGLGYGTSDEKLIAISLDFLRTGKYGTSAVAIIGKRAEISSAGSPIRSILPVLLIPIIVSQLGNMGNTTLILPMILGPSHHIFAPQSTFAR